MKPAVTKTMNRVIEEIGCEVDEFSRAASQWVLEGVEWWSARTPSPTSPWSSPSTAGSSPSARGGWRAASWSWCWQASTPCWAG